MKLQNRYATTDSVLDLATRVDNLKEEIKVFAKTQDVNNQIELLSNEFKYKISDFITSEAVKSSIGILEAKIRKVKRETKEELEIFEKTINKFQDDYIKYLILVLLKIN